MKLFHEENGREVVYVQMQDLAYLNEKDISIPASIYMKVFSNPITIINNQNRFDFVKFEEKEEVQFFKELEFIIDFDKYKNLTDEEIEAQGDKLATRALEIEEKWNEMTKKEQEKNSDEYQDIKYILAYFSEIHAIKHGKNTMPFPEFVSQPTPKKKSFIERLKERLKKF